ncbi:MAG TPA: exodeoxyribonuclease VII large subunit [Burkholderiaceae bacterium]|nr:exodeoxyribonuclease VII large subunit [Burkholderiaceae bacterium]
MDSYRPEPRAVAASAGREDRPARDPLTVTQLNRAVAGLLERSVPPLAVIGEISNFTRAGSGHWYFTLKDAGAQVRSVMFRGRAQFTGFMPRDGMRVEVRALVSMYEPRGEFQLVVEAMRQAGAGDLYQQFLQLKERLQGEGLFDVTRKRPAPAMPRAIGIVTSPAAAALRDVLTTLARRAPQIPVVLYPTPVQGAEAAGQIAAALQRAVRRAECDVLLLVRGGGSIEDLWAFNDERLARVIAASPIVVVSGVGHDTDFTIADFAADQRAATPTAAAALAAPDRAELAGRVLSVARHLVRAGQRSLQRREQALDAAARLLRPPSAHLAHRRLRLQNLAQRLAGTGRRLLRDAVVRLAAAEPRLRMPDVAQRERDLRRITERLQRAARQKVGGRHDALEQLAHRLASASPDAVLARGYAIVLKDDGSVLRDPADAARGDALQVRLAHGDLAVRVEDRIDR